MKRSSRAGAIGLAIIVLLLLPVSSAKAGKEQRVRFQKGRTTAILKGRLPRESAEYDAYIVRARAGQTLTAHLATGDKQAYLKVFSLELGPGEDMLTPEEDDIIQDWSGKLPVPGDYSVQVYTNGAGGNYTLEVTIR
jgi:hypothetical protein